MSLRESTAPIRSVAADSYRIPTDRPEADGTLAWEATVLVVVRIEAGGKEGIGYGYADAATARCIRDHLAPRLEGKDALAINARWHDMAVAVRNLGRRGIAAMAIAAVDTALWDLKAKCHEVALVALLGAARTEITAYASGGFTSYSQNELEAQLGGWAAQGFSHIKMKIGSQPADDMERVRLAAACIGEAQLFVDANGAYTRKQALAFAEQFAELGVGWFEEPVSSDDLEGLNLLRDRAPAGMDVAAGEYGYDLGYFRRMLQAQAVDVLQADATRCGGVTGFLGAAALCEAFEVPLSAHCAPALHMALCCTVRPAVHLEYFHDHARIESMLFDGAVQPVGGCMKPDLSRPGLGIVFKERDAQCFSNS